MITFRLAGVSSNSHKLMNMSLMLSNQFVEGSEMPRSNEVL
jgi:hypothetical protein